MLKKFLKSSVINGKEISLKRAKETSLLNNKVTPLISDKQKLINDQNDEVNLINYYRFKIFWKQENMFRFMSQTLMMKFSPSQDSLGASYRKKVMVDIMPQIINRLKPQNKKSNNLYISCTYINNRPIP